MKRIVGEERVYVLPYDTEPDLGVGECLDLRRCPQRLARIPELRQQPKLKEFVKALNSPDSIFMTFGCAYAKDKPRGWGAKLPELEGSAVAAHTFSAYVVFSFWLFRQNIESEFVGLYESYQDSDRTAAAIFILGPANYLSRFEMQQHAAWVEKNGTVCTLWTTGWGESAAEAHARWENCVDRLIAHFAGYRMNAETTKRWGTFTISSLFESEDRLPLSSQISVP